MHAKIPRAKMVGLPLFLCAYLFAATSPVLARPAACNAFEGAAIVAEDGTYLGKLTNPYDTKSVFNKYGTHGSPYSAKSIWNKYGIYGSEYSIQSPMNPYSTKGPAIISGSKLLGYLTKNKYRSGAVDPVILGVSCFDYEPED